MGTHPQPLHSTLLLGPWYVGSLVHTGAPGRSARRGMEGSRPAPAGGLSPAPGAVDLAAPAAPAAAGGATALAAGAALAAEKLVAGAADTAGNAARPSNTTGGADDTVPAAPVAAPTWGAPASDPINTPLGASMGAMP